VTNDSKEINLADRSHVLKLDLTQAHNNPIRD
jgi:hypothetical protein